MRSAVVSRRGRRRVLSGAGGVAEGGGAGRDCRDDRPEVGRKKEEIENVIRNQSRMWVQTNRPVPAKEAEKQAIIAACEAFIRDVLKPRFLPAIKPTEWNYPIDIRGAWAGGRYRFIQRYRSGFADNRGEEFDAPFARIDRRGPDKFDVYWMRHNGQWWRLYTGMTLTEALHAIETDPVLQPF
jgi:hypothetical protein